MSPLPDGGNGTSQVGSDGPFGNQKAQKCAYGGHWLTTTAGVESAGFMANELTEVRCTQPAPVRLAALKGLDQPTRVADVIVTRVAGQAMDAHQIVIKTS